MYDKAEDYVEFIMRQIVLFQEKNGDILNVKDIGAISRILERVVKSEILSKETKELNIPLSYIIGNAIMTTEINPKSIKKEMSKASKNRLKELREEVTFQNILKESNFVKEVKKSRNLISDYLIENIPAIDCGISSEGLRAGGYTEDGYETIYEVEINDERAFSKDVRLISMKDAIQKEEIQTPTQK